MINLEKGFESFKGWVFDRYSGEAAKMLLEWGALGWIFSSMAHVGGIIKNKEISSDEKKFLVPQEILDAVVNIGSFYILTYNLQNYAKKLVSSSKLLTPEIRKFLDGKKIPLGKKGPDIGKFFEDNMKIFKNDFEIASKGESPVSKAEAAVANLKINELASFEKKYDQFAGGIKMVGNLVGAIFSCNILTPVLRNYFASIEQKRRINSGERPDAVKIPTPAITPAVLAIQKPTVPGGNIGAAKISPITNLISLQQSMRV